MATITDVVNPQGMDADKKGNLYVASTGNSQVNVYTPNTYTAAYVLADPRGSPWTLPSVPTERCGSRTSTTRCTAKATS